MREREKKRERECVCVLTVHVNCNLLFSLVVHIILFVCLFYFAYIHMCYHSSNINVKKVLKEVKIDILNERDVNLT